jgi:chromosome segregation ATPase
MKVVKLSDVQALRFTDPALESEVRRALDELARSNDSAKKAVKGTWDGHRRELGQVAADLQRLNADLDRIRKNLRETPPQAEVYKTYLNKLSDQEKEIDALTAKQKRLMSEEFAAKKAFEDYLATLTD